MPVQSPAPPVPLRRIFQAASIACGVQFGWALQLSLLTPYVQELGIPHAWASLVWLCGPISGLFVQPVAGHLSDRCGSKWGRRRPFIVSGAAAISVAVLTIGFASDIGRVLGDSGSSKIRAIVVFVVGFWMLDVANNMIQGPCRALLADLAGHDRRRIRNANSYFSLFMALGNILGFAAGSFSDWANVLPFTLTSSCGISCANLKSAFLIGIAILAFTTCLTLTAAPEVPLHIIKGNKAGPSVQALEHEHASREPAMSELFSSLRYLSRPVLLIMLVTGLMWLAWFPFLLFDTDWMGRDVYKGVPSKDAAGQNSYNIGVRVGAFGLLLNSVVLGFVSLTVEQLCRKWGSALVWGVSNFLMFVCFLMMNLISFIAERLQYSDSGLPPDGIVIAALSVFAILGVPLAITYSVPYSMIAHRTKSLGLGQGLAMGILNLSVVIPQMIVALGSGPWDQLFGGGNRPSIGLAAGAAFASGFLAILALPRGSAEKSRGQP